MLRIIAVAALAALVLAPSPAAAEPQCAPRAALVRALASQYGEIPAASGLTSNGSLMEVLTSPSGTWSVLVTQPGGASCLVLSGEGWQGSPPALPGRDS